MKDSGSDSQKLVSGPGNRPEQSDFPQDLSWDRAWDRVSRQTSDLRFLFETSVGPDAFDVVAFQGTEELFDCFDFHIDLASYLDDIDLNKLLDTPAVLTIEKRDEPPRYIHGVIAEIERRAVGISRTMYRIVLRPALHRLRYMTDSRIFQGHSVPDIAGMLLQEAGVSDVAMRLHGTHNPREYCVCYQETLFDFLRRLLAEEGIFFWFEYSKASHTLVLSDAPLAMPFLEAMPSIVFNDRSDGVSEISRITHFSHVERVRATTRAARDYTFKSPAASQDIQSSQYESNGTKRNYELFQYPGRYKNADAGKIINDAALEAHRVDATTGEGETNCVHLVSGFIFELTGHPNKAANTNHRLLTVRHEGRQENALQEDAPENAATTYQASFVTQPARLPYRGVNPNPRPYILGLQIAHVTGPAGEEIYCDEHGRVKIWFPWDRYGTLDDKSSCWIRVMRNAAGGGMGSVAVPRVGHEVVVAFLDGDPDQPIIAGCSYHATNTTPYSLPANKTKMVMRSQVPGTTGFNELSFEDTPGGEELFIQAERRKLEIVGNNSLTIQTMSTGASGVAQIMGAGAASVAGSLLMSVLCPPTIVAGVAMVKHTASAAGEMAKKRK